MTTARVNRVSVRTPEGVVFTFALAGPFARMLAWFVDLMAIGAGASIIGTFVRAISPLSPDFAQAIFVAGYFVLSTGYGMVLEWLWRGQTLGKRVLHLRVMDERGLPLSASQVVLRNLLRTVDVLPVGYLVGGAAMLLGSRAQRLGDLAAGTIVVRHAHVTEPDFGQLFSGRFNTLREHATIAARLRQQLPPVLIAAATDALLRREQLEAGARVALFAEISAACRRFVALPPELFAAMPDEALVRDIVEVVHEGRAEVSPAPSGSVLK